MKYSTIWVFAFLFIVNYGFGQNSSKENTAEQLPGNYLNSVSKQSKGISDAIEKKSQKLLRRLQRQEGKLKSSLYNLDSVQAAHFFAEGQAGFTALGNKLSQKNTELEGRLKGEYLPYFDSLKGSLSFLKTGNPILSNVNAGKLTGAIASVSDLQGKFQQADAIKQFVKERKAQLQELVSHYTSVPKQFQGALTKYNKELYYYSQQIREYREILNDPGKMEKAALAILNKIPAFQLFMKSHSELGSLFSVPGEYGSLQGIEGLQSKSDVQQAIGNQFGNATNVQQVLSKQVQSAQSQLQVLKQKINTLGAGNGDLDMPQFKVNEKRIKPFLKRLEYGINTQSARSNYYFPTTTDIGLSAAYMLNTKNSVGLGASYKVGWGRDIKHIAFSSQGLSLRSFIEINIKQSFFASGGFEYNYQQPFQTMRELYNVNSWQQSGLLGVTKVVSLKGGVMKKTKLQLLWDFLSYYQIPKAQALKFRVGYAF